MPRDLVAFPAHDWHRRLADGESLRQAALCDGMIQDPDISRFFWIRRVHPRRLFAGLAANAAFVRRPLLPLPGGVLYRIERYRGMEVEGRYLLEHHLPHSADTLLAFWLKGIFASLRVVLPVLWVGDPKEAWVFRALSASRRVFDAMDDWGLAPEFLHQRVAIRDGYRMALRADTVTCNTEGAGRRFHAHPDLRLLPNAAGDGLVPAHAPAERPRRRLGLVGHYSYGRLEPDLLCRTLEARPDCEIIHIGSFRQDGERLRRALAHPRFLSLGEMDVARTRAQMRRLDALLTPHPVCPYTRSQDRLTVYDALAMGLPVVSTELPPADRLHRLCYVARNAGEWGACLDAALAEPVTRRDARRAAMDTETWQTRRASLKEILCT